MPQVAIRDRIKEFKRIPANKVLTNPRNWRKHPKEQREAMRTLLKNIGFASACLVRELDDGNYMLIDGHLRREEMESKGNNPIPCLILDVTEEEADILLATVDPLGAMAEADGGLLRDLIADLQAGDEAMVGLFSDIPDLYGIKDKDKADAPEPTASEENGQPEVSHVRMVQLFMTTETLPAFQEALEFLGEKLGTDTLTETIDAAVKRLYKILKEKE